MLDKQVLQEPPAGPQGLTPPPFVCSWTTDGANAAWVTVAGDLDIATTPDLARTLREARLVARVVVLDLRGVTFLDSAAVHIVLDESISAREAGHRLVVLRAPPSSDRVFTLTGASDHVELLDASGPSMLAHGLARSGESQGSSLRTSATIAARGAGAITRGL